MFLSPGSWILEELCSGAGCSTNHSVLVRRWGWGWGWDFYILNVSKRDRANSLGFSYLPLSPTGGGWGGCSFFTWFMASPRVISNAGSPSIWFFAGYSVTFRQLTLWNLG